ncbi:hypothetical protein M1N20_00655 [Dehalococcoidia bacterium]|nr:hypothetical protein [Dehalococcoidia bacterium]
MAIRRFNVLISEVVIEEAGLGDQEAAKRRLEELKHFPHLELDYESGGVTMWQDPIVEEVRKAGEELAKQANYDLHTFFENLRNNEKRQNQKIVSLKEDGRLKGERGGTPDSRL